MAYNNKTYNGHNGGYGKSSKPKSPSAPALRPQQSVAQKTEAVVPTTSKTQVNIWASLISVLAVIVRFFPIKLEKAKKERTLVVVKVFGFEFSDVEWTDVLLVVLVFVLL